MPYPPYRFSSLQQFQRSDVPILNRASRFLVDSVQMKRILKAVADLLVQYEIFELEDVEITLLVKPVGHIGKPQVRKFLQPLITIGRTNENDIFLKSPIVSKKHATILRQGVSYFLKDLRSENGTHLNQVKLDPEAEVPLKNDDVIKVDPFEIKIGLPAESSIAKRPLRIELSSIRVCRQIKPARLVSVLFQLQPGHHTGILLVEEQSAGWFIQKIFTGQQQIASLSTWTEIETGFFEYLVCKILAAVSPFLQNSRPVLLTIEKEEKLIQEWLSKSLPAVELVLTTQTEIGLLGASLLLPDQALGEASVSVNFLHQAAWISNLLYSFSLRVGVAFLSSEQINQLEEGDIILLDRATVALTQDGVTGTTELRCPQLRRGVIRGSLLCAEDDKAKITVQGLSQEGLERMTEANKKAEAPAEAGMPEVLSSIEIPVIVEFARLNFTLEELSAFKEGQVIELEKSRPEQVDLSVEGRVVANGKLVDVEGKLGVQLSKILKPKSRE